MKSLSSLIHSSRRGVATAWIVLIVLAVFGIILVIWGTSSYNRFITLDESVKASWAQVENQLQRRFDLIPNLVETVKGFADQEKSVLLGVTEARARVGSSATPEQRMAAENNLSGALSRLLVVVENYPTLKSDQNFLRLQDELAGTENRIAVERKRYNELVRDYNIAIRRFPTNILAGMFGFGTRVPFEAPAEAKVAPKVTFR